MSAKFFRKPEYKNLKRLYVQSPRSPYQQNSFNTADVEILKLLSSCQFLVSSTDSLAIEIHSQLYRNPKTWGYLAVANSVSDLAASGAKPLGMLISSQWSSQHRRSVREQVHSSMAEALQFFNVPLLGGDSGSSKETVLTTTILGSSAIKPLSRVGVRSGDLILALGDLLGFGPMLAFDFLKSAGKSQLEKKFRPNPDWKTANIFRKYFHASIDSSDGVYNSLETLAIINNVHFCVDLNAIKLPTKVQTYKLHHRIPMEYFIESDLGDLQTLFAIHPEKYLLIKNRLPSHQIIARATHANSKKNSHVHYENISSANGHYKPLPHLLESNNFAYQKTLARWLAQFGRSL